MTKKLLKATISVILALVISIVSCTSVFAATSNERYISDIIVCSASSADDATAKLKEQGYKLMSTEAVSSGMYIGYKSTTKKSEAITNISAMNMNGKYSFTDYQNLLNGMKENVSATVDGLIPMIDNYRANYKDKTTIAVEVHDVLNKFYEDDSAQYMGDYLLNCDLKDTTDITKVFMEGYSPFIVDIEELLFIAGEDDSDKTWIEKMAKSDPDYVIDTYVSAYPMSVNQAISAMSSDFGDYAETFRTTWDTMYTNFSDLKEKYFTENDGDLVLNESAVKGNVESASKDAETQLADDATLEEAADVINTADGAVASVDEVADVNLMTYLNSLEYGDGTMLDFFMRSEEEVDDCELYTLAYFMGDNLASQVKNVGLQETVSRATVDSDNAEKNDFAGINATLGEFDEMSIYDGSDRSLYEDGVALTSATTEKYTASGKDWSDGLFSRIFQPTNEFKWKDFAAFYVLPAVASTLIYAGLRTLNKNINKYLYKSCVETVAKSAKEVVGAGKYAYSLEANVPSTVYTVKGSLSNFVKQRAYNKLNDTYGQSAIYRGMSYVQCAFFVLMIATTIITTVMLFVTLFTDKEADAKYSAVPNHIVDTVSTDNGDDYIAYNYVKNLDGSAGDLENYKGKKGWLCLFYTKDTSAGDPITTDMKIVKGSTDAPLDYENLSMFGESKAINLTAQDYTGVTDSANGTYMYFNRAESSTTTASIFSNSYIGIAIIAGGVVGIIFGIFLPKPKKKTKKQTA